MTMRPPAIVLAELLLTSCQRYRVFVGLLLQRFKTPCLDSVNMVIVKILGLSICHTRKNILTAFLCVFLPLFCVVKTFGSNFQFGLSLDDFYSALRVINPLAPSNETLSRQWLSSVGRLGLQA